jgi:hypothetical protein
MAEKDKPLLMREMTLGQKIALGQVTRMPGFQVIVAIIEAGCNRATANAINLSPEEPNYDQLVKARHQYAYDVNHFTRLVRDSINWHSENGIIEEQQEQAAAKEAVEAQKE